MKKVGAYSLDEEMIELIKRYAKVLNCSESEIVQKSLINFLDRGQIRYFQESEFKKKDIRLGILEQERKQELQNALKGSRNISLKECGDRNE